MKGLWGWSTIGKLRVRLRDTITGAETAPLWEKSGNQGNVWLRGDVAINNTWTVTQVAVCWCYRNVIHVKLGSSHTFSRELTNNKPSLR